MLPTGLETCLVPYLPPCLVTHIACMPSPLAPLLPQPTPLLPAPIAPLYACPLVPPPPPPPNLPQPYCLCLVPVPTLPCNTCALYFCPCLCACSIVVCHACSTACLVRQATGTGLGRDRKGFRRRDRDIEFGTFVSFFHCVDIWDRDFGRANFHLAF